MVFAGLGDSVGFEDSGLASAVSAGGAGDAGRIPQVISSEILGLFSVTKKVVDPLSIAQSEFGFREFRPGQAESIEALTAGRDALVVMPTGSGKSAIYQIAGMAIRGTVLVVSPLIALQKDQVESINGAEGEAAVVINSGVTAAEQRARLERVAGGCCKFIFLAPEQITAKRGGGGFKAGQRAVDCGG